MTERELLITGIGGQGVQLAAQVIAKAATLEGRDVMFFGIYGGMMRGGNTDSTVVVADSPITAPPVGRSGVVGHRDARRVLGTARAPAARRRLRARERLDVRTRDLRSGHRAPHRSDRARGRSSGTRWAARWSWSAPTAGSPGWSVRTR